ncbi:GapR family DNA-binding domain-containing protein [Novosphingobium mangrovi (ex Huang et al. 2023)]|uniref:DUF2312 domain-containing protein n=1 Tax=Novosphingobium mangrovi (ex Huang et al. 2023) TaxID=2976432 RepID=A0ABT2I130_9SPHN|nr:GapR family DNA-binding domain-containing protein [Novosphingobium mangrovi (ex Huang et al. 2023)]MCT2398513.1 DUF2312 domain-containing protein [Novosphingobium mangrovi (ex Huang et al. 2023)]
MDDDLSGRRDPSSGHSKDLLLGHIRAVRDLRDQRRDINADIAARKKEARDQGFDSTKIEEVVRWMEKCDKHGRETMDEAEALYEMYRAVVDARGEDFDSIMADARDRALLKIFAPEDQLAPQAPTRKQRAVTDAMAAAHMSRMARG